MNIFRVQSEIPHRAISVYMYLQARANKQKECYPAINTIARELKLSRSTVKRAINDLTRENWLKKERRYRQNGGYSSNLYILLK